MIIYFFIINQLKNQFNRIWDFLFKNFNYFPTVFKKIFFLVQYVGPIEINLDFGKIYEIIFIR